MRSIIKRIINEAVTKKLRDTLKSVGPKEARNLTGMSIEDYVDIVYDLDAIGYVESVVPELLNLQKGRSGYSYNYNGDGPLRGTVFLYASRYRTNRGRIVEPFAIIPRMKLNYLTEYMTKDILIDFINEFYDLDVTRIVPD